MSLTFDPIPDGVPLPEVVAHTNQQLLRMVTEILRLGGQTGPILLLNTLDMNNNPIIHVGQAKTPSSTDAARVSDISPSTIIQQIRSSLSATGSTPLNVSQLPGTTTVVLAGTHAARPAPGAFPGGVFYVETDRLAIYFSKSSGIGTAWTLVASLTMVAVFGNRPSDLGVNDIGFRFAASDQNNVRWRWTGTAFVYELGSNIRTQAQLAALAALLGANDVGYLAFVSDFGHVLKWTGAAWDWGPGERGSNPIEGLPFAPSGSAAAWFQLCDGTATTYLKADGTTGAFTTPNLAGQYLKYRSAGYTGVQPAGGTTADESTHTHGVTIANNINVTAVGPDGAAAAQTVTSAGGTAHHHDPGTLDLARVEMLPYFRR